MKKPVIAVGLVLTGICLALYVFEPTFVTAVSNAAYDVLLRHSHGPQRSDDVVLVDLDEASLAERGQWPWPRYLVADLTRRLQDAGATVVVFDILFCEPDRTSPDRVAAQVSAFFDVSAQLDGIPPDLRDFDRLLAEVLSRGISVLGCHMLPPLGTTGETVAPPDDNYRGHFYARGSGDVHRHLSQASGVRVALPALSRAASNNAFFNTLPDADSIVRRTPLIWGCGTDRIYPALALEAVRLHLGVSQVGIEYGSEGIRRLRLNDRVIPTDERGMLFLNYRSTTFPTYSATRVLSGEVGKKEFSGKIAFIGTSAAGLRDLRATPLQADFAGVGIQATAAENILSSDFLRFPGWMKGFEAALIACMGIFLTIIIHRQRAWLSFIITAAVIVASVFMSVVLLNALGLIFVPSRSIFAILLIYPVLTMVSYWQQEIRARWIRGTFGAMVSRDVLEYLEKEPESSTLATRRTEATVLFSDLAGFTTMSERLGAEQITRLLNDYLSPMAKIIMDRKGYVDKYVGDMIMAEWGVPFRAKDHAVQACLAAIEQQQALEALRPELKARFDCDVRARIGVNTGTVTAGNMGSDSRFQYTVMGDTVNVASRLEPLNKQYGTSIIIGQSTFEQAKDAIQTRLLDRVQVAGRVEEILIYELVGLQGRVPAERIESIELYEEALRSYWDEEWERPVECLRTLLRMNPSDAAAARLIEKITGMRWDPETVAKTPVVAG